VWKVRLLILTATVISYLPALNNGFIADDWVILHRVDVLKEDPLYLNEVVPENFRLTSYVVFGLLKTLFGYNAAPFYVFNILLHALNCILLAALVREITGDSNLGWISGLFLAVFQSPQEAVMWLAAMNETLSVCFMLLTSLFWMRGKQAIASLIFIAALYSKESALILVLLVPLVELNRGKHVAWRDYWILALPAMLFSVFFILTLSVNFQLGHGTYALGPQGLLVLIKSLHRLIWPWGYLVVAAVLLSYGWRPNRQAADWALLIPVAMLPYIFVRYAANIPSRQTYLASALFLPLLAAGMLSLKPKTLRAGLVAAFIVYNVVYMWTVKDAQMEARALPTTALVKALREYSPQDVRLRGFEYSVDLIPKAVAVSLPGWRWDQVDLDVPCQGCLLFEWNHDTGRYAVSKVPREKF
jgi:hypothetical protein